MPQEFLFYKTRLAPTPSGYLHAGNAFNFLLTVALAKQNGARLLLRVDDLDRERYRQAYAEDVFDTLRFLNIHWDEGPQNLGDLEAQWSQRHRMNLYQTALERLRANDVVFACTCSRTQSEACNCRAKALPLDAPNASWRLVTDDRNITVRTLEGDAVTEALPPPVQNFVVRKRDGLPAYQLSSVVDDLYFGIDLIVRGNDLWPSTLAQHFLAQVLGEDRFAAIAFHHHPLLKNSKGDKLSKSAGDSSVKHWRESGKTLAEFFDCLSALLPKPTTAHNLGEWQRIFAP